MPFVKAEKKNLYLRIGLAGVAGGGKTKSALKMGAELARLSGKRLALIDTEYKSSVLYADEFDFDVCELIDFAPDNYVAAIKEAEASGAGCLVIDGLTQAWSGKNGALDQKDRAEKRSGNGYTAWRDITPMHNRLIDAMLGCRMHLIATLREKTDYVIEPNEKGKMAPRKVGLAPVQREGMEYEFTIFGSMNNGDLTITKSRYSPFDQQVFHHPGAEQAAQLWSWANSATGPAELPTQAIQAIEGVNHSKEALLYYAKTRGVATALSPLVTLMRANGLPARPFSEADWDQMVDIIDRVALEIPETNNVPA